ncbi:subclass B3 metallo-beta-lactamase [Sphingobium sp. EM0848]|uniref:subclass B3 metallo-beta-lactamase n=1 Tax=Sphingobium sp. EM0848 TaxID=2743473 RepID=UPI002100B6F8|nr:subclass B3 metallo-beta-lactamase [Sphingobium sp. EM0848]
MSLFAAGNAMGRAATGDPLLRPIAPDHAKQWLAPQQPMRIFGNVYLVGFGGLNVGLVRTSAGLILIDGAVPQAVPAVEANIRRLGFRLEDVKLILSTEPHWDHAGGLAALARDTRATVLASAAAAGVLRTGHSGPDDPQAPALETFPPVSSLRVVRDGETVRLGNTVVTAIATPGHTQGSMSWRWTSCEGRRCLPVVFASSFNPIAAQGQRLTEPAHRWTLDAFPRSFARMRRLPCGILLSAHPEQSDGDRKLTLLRKKREPNPFIDPGACRAYANRFARLFTERVEKERGAK